MQSEFQTPEYCKTSISDNRQSEHQVNRCLEHELRVDDYDDEPTVQESLNQPTFGGMSHFNSGSNQSQSYGVSTNSYQNRTQSDKEQQNPNYDIEDISVSNDFKRNIDKIVSRYTSIRDACEPNRVFRELNR